MELLRRLWTEEVVDFDGTFHKLEGAGITPLPTQRPIPMWIGAAGVPVDRVRRRIGRQADGWFNLCSPEEFPELRDDIYREAEAVGRDPKSLGVEAGVAVVGPREAEWKSRIAGWRDLALTHICLRTLGGGLEKEQHIEKMREAVAELPQV